MKCKRCGTDNPRGKNVCLKCGNFLYSANPDNRVPLTREQKLERRKSIAKGAGLGCVWSLLIIIGMLVFLGLISYLLVRFVLPEDLYDDLPTAVTTSILPALRARLAAG